MGYILVQILVSGHVLYLHLLQFSKLPQHMRRQMPLNNIITNQRKFSPSQLLVSLADRIEVHCFYLITLI
jgi:hypothetical protein